MTICARSIGFVLAAATLAAACASNIKTARLSMAQLGTKYARHTAYFAACGTYCVEEKTVGTIRHEVIRDEATLLGVGPAETCFDLVVRTESTHDEPFDQLDASCQLDGVSAQTAVDSETVTVTDYDYTGQVETLHVEAIALESFMSLSLSEPRDMTYRVIERTGRVCCGAAANRSVQLEMRNQSFDVGAAGGKLKFRWDLQ